MTGPNDTSPSAHVPDGPTSLVRRWLRRWWKQVVPVPVLLLVIPVVLHWDVFTCGGPASGVRLTDGQCVGVTDGSFVYHEEYTEVQADIVRENQRVAEAGGHVVRIALLSTLTFGEVSPMDPARVVSALEGAHTAQMRANHSPHFGDESPAIQLYLANMGGRQGQWEPVVDALVAMADDEANPLVAVVGMGVSVESTASVADRLHENGIPMVSAAVTADGLAHPETPGLMRAAPSNTEYVRALRSYLDEQKEPARATLVYDANASDLFVGSLRQAYESRLGAHLVGHPQEYAGTTVGDPPRAGLFHTVVLNICASGTDTVFFAGRTPDLREFLASLAHRPCAGQPFRVLFSVIGLSALDDEEVMGHLAEGDITLVYASSIDPRWSTGDASAEVPPHYASFVNAFHEYIGDDDPAALNNGYALVHHDAFAVAASAVRMTNEMDLGDAPPTAAEVGSQLMLLNSAHEVRAGGGTLSYSDEYGGEAVGRYVPVVELPLKGDLPRPFPHVIGGAGHG
ncbi:ABC transporter substrate-binding protein [Nocardiopsis lambiniae]|uniref:ABC transporter substrate-binding protein n=1 Tax=Nocardiopsis lambiniae TaxID=3075539 RepID=A0ABU2M2Z0_9ACTN|nr:ABC transporter substrate-binding protein [Nocardiopsis sp. DSM 44743]MDT0327010.1 ABC transporter substrate-binding protein [Nocardiopsis sp. DSM 44743]